MGYYIETPSNHGKADWLIKEHGAVEVLFPVPFWSTNDRDEVTVCVVDNGPFEAAAIACDEKELERFKREPDPRPKRWLILPRAKVLELCPKVKEVL